MIEMAQSGSLIAPYDVGFMLRAGLDARLATWALAPDGNLIETPSSWLMPVRRGGLPAMLKVFKPHSDERDAARYLRYLDGKAAVRVLAADDESLLMERVDGGRSLAAMALSGADEEAAEILAATILELQAPRADPIPPALVPLTEQFAALFRRSAEHGLLARCAAVARRLLATQRDVTPLHGDLHHNNVLDGGARGWLAIDPKGVLGERTYETANLLRNPWPHAGLVHDADRMRRLADLYAARLGLDATRILSFGLVHCGLGAAWDMDDGCDPAYSLKCAELLADLVAPAAI
jgi:streptomycin 6-kinase